MPIPHKKASSPTISTQSSIESKSHTKYKPIKPKMAHGITKPHKQVNLVVFSKISSFSLNVRTIYVPRQFHHFQRHRMVEIQIVRITNENENSLANKNNQRKYQNG